MGRFFWSGKRDFNNDSYLFDIQYITISNITKWVTLVSTKSTAFLSTSASVRRWNWAPSARNLSPVVHVVKSTTTHIYYCDTFAINATIMKKLISTLLTAMVIMAVLCLVSCSKNHSSDTTNNYGFKYPTNCWGGGAVWWEMHENRIYQQPGVIRMPGMQPVLTCISAAIWVSTIISVRLWPLDILYRTALRPMNG